MKVLIAIGQIFPVSWRLKMTWSPLGRPLRRLLNVASSELFPVISLSSPLAGYRMRLDWQTQKGFVFGVYPLLEIQVMTREITECAVVCDVGAHVGYFTLLMARLVGAGGRVVAFEALPDNARVVAENSRINRLPQVEVVAKAVLDCAQTVQFASEDADPLTMTAYIATNGGRWSVAAVSSDEYFTGRPERISFVKMDVQGAEDRVLAGMRRILTEHRPTLLVELHDIQAHGEEHPALAHLREAGYSWTFLCDFPPPAEVRWPLPYSRVNSPPAATEACASPGTGAAMPEVSCSSSRRSAYSVGWTLSAGPSPRTFIPSRRMALAHWTAPLHARRAASCSADTPRTLKSYDAPGPDFGRIARSQETRQLAISGTGAYTRRDC